MAVQSGKKTDRPGDQPSDKNKEGGKGKVSSHVANWSRGLDGHRIKPNSKSWKDTGRPGHHSVRICEPVDETTGLLSHCCCVRLDNDSAMKRLHSCEFPDQRLGVT